MVFMVRGIYSLNVSFNMFLMLLGFDGIFIIEKDGVE